MLLDILWCAGSPYDQELFGPNVNSADTEKLWSIGCLEGENSALCRIKNPTCPGILVCRKAQLHGTTSPKHAAHHTTSTTITEIQEEAWIWGTESRYTAPKEPTQPCGMNGSQLLVFIFCFSFYWLTWKWKRGLSIFPNTSGFAMKRRWK